MVPTPDQLIDRCCSSSPPRPLEESWTDWAGHYIANSSPANSGRVPHKVRWLPLTELRPLPSAVGRGGTVPEFPAIAELYCVCFTKTSC